MTGGARGTWWRRAWLLACLAAAGFATPEGVAGDEEVARFEAARLELAARRRAELALREAILRLPPDHDREAAATLEERAAEATRKRLAAAATLTSSRANIDRLRLAAGLEEPAGSFFTLLFWVGLLGVLGLVVFLARDVLRDLVQGMLLIVERRASSRATVHVTVAYEEDADRIAELLRRVAREVREDFAQHSFFPEAATAQGEDGELIAVDRFEESGILWRLSVRTQPLREKEVEEELRSRVREALRALGLAAKVREREREGEGAEPSVAS
ncbi:MAG: hypothetical protein O7J95_17240 [Planctomycetota bacterium]|nr:hypothetical protein [Planctomycetota bacterium]